MNLRNGKLLPIFVNMARAKSEKKLDLFFRKPLLIIFLFVFLLYGNSIKNDYNLDDDFVTSTYTHSNPRIERGLKGIPDLFVSRYIETEQQSFSYRPLVLVTFALEYQFFGKSPHLSHFINVLLYSLICIVLFLLLQKLFAGYSNFLPFIIVLLYASHPLHSEIVCSLKNRDELLSFLFGLISIRYVLKGFDSGKHYYIILSVVFILLAILSKETAVVLIPLIFLIIYYFKKVSRSQLVLALSAMFIVLAFYKIMQMQLKADHTVLRDYVFTENPLFYENNFKAKFPAALSVMLFYLKLMFIPFPLSSYYGYNTVSLGAWNDPLIWISFIIHISLAIYAFLNIKRNKILSFGILFYLIAIIPYSNFFRPAPGIVAERFAFVATLGFCIAIAAFLFIVAEKYFKRVSRPLYIISISILLFFSLRTMSRNSDWKNLETLFNRDLKYYDNSYNMHYVMANALTNEIMRKPNAPDKKEKIKSAIYHYNKVAEIVQGGLKNNPKDALSRNNLGSVYVNYLHRPELAKPLFLEAIRIKPSYTEAYYNLAYCYDKLNITDSAIFYFEETLRKDSLQLEAYKKLNDIYVSKEMYDRAILVSKKATGNFKNNAEMLINLGNNYMFLKDTALGVKCFVAAVKAEPSNSNLRAQVGDFLSKSGYNNDGEKLK